MAGLSPEIRSAMRTLAALQHAREHAEICHRTCTKVLELVAQHHAELPAALTAELLPVVEKYGADMVDLGRRFATVNLAQTAEQAAAVRETGQRLVQ